MARSRDRWGGPISVPNQSPKSTPTMSTKEGGTPTVRRGGSGGGGISTPAPISQQIIQSTPTNQAQVQAQLSANRGLTVQQRAAVSQPRPYDISSYNPQTNVYERYAGEKPFTFSGKVQDVSEGAQGEAKYYVQGKPVGRTFTQDGQTYAETIKPSTFTFRKGGTTEQVKFTPEGAEIQTQEQVTVSDLTSGWNISPDLSSLGYGGTPEYAQGTKLNYGQQDIVLPSEFFLPSTYFNPSTNRTEYMGEVQPVEKLSIGQGGLLQSLESTRSSLYAESLTTQNAGDVRGILSGFGTFAKQIGVGVLSSFVGTGLSIKNFLVNPDPEQIITGTKQTYQFLSSGEAAKVINKEPGFAVGYVGGEALQSYLPQLVVKISDVVRVKGLTKIEAADIIAPEYFAGQNYPSIKSGQTAGNLLEEFKQLDIYGSTQLRGFTASPKPFSEVTVAGAGSSELAGVYQAPKVSPSFLKIGGGEKSFFTINPFKTTLSPSIIQIIPDEYLLAPGISYGQTGLSSLKNIKNIWSNLDLGKSYIPFIKTEKEAIIPAGTLLARTDKRFFINFEGRNVPIFQFRTETGGAAITGFTASELADISSSSRVGSTAYISSYDIGKVVKNFASSISYSTTSSINLPPIISPSYASHTSTSTSFIKSKPSYPSKGSNRSQSYLSSPSIASSTRSVFSMSLSIRKSIYSSTPRLPPSIPRLPSLYPSLKEPPIKKYGSQRRTARVQTSDGFNVFVRRGGLFKPVGVNLSFMKAFNLGKQITQFGLGQTFKIRGTGRVPSFKIPQGYYSKYEKKEGLVFIEQPKSKINVSREKGLLSLARLMKGGSRKKRR